MPSEPGDGGYRWCGRMRRRRSARRARGAGTARNGERSATRPGEENREIITLPLVALADGASCRPGMVGRAPGCVFPGSHELNWVPGSGAYGTPGGDGDADPDQDQAADQLARAARKMLESAPTEADQGHPTLTAPIAMAAHRLTW